MPEPPPAFPSLAPQTGDYWRQTMTIITPGFRTVTIAALLVGITALAGCSRPPERTTTTTETSTSAALPPPVQSSTTTTTINRSTTNPTQ